MLNWNCSNIDSRAQLILIAITQQIHLVIIASCLALITLNRNLRQIVAHSPFENKSSTCCDISLTHLCPVFRHNNSIIDKISIIVVSSFQAINSLLELLFKLAKHFVCPMDFKRVVFAPIDWIGPKEKQNFYLNGHNDRYLVIIYAFPQKEASSEGWRGLWFV